jgi:peptide/nickel transport system substrate-binding protein
MRKRLGTRLGAGALVALALLAAGCGGGGGSAPADTTEFHIGWDAQPATLDPVMTTATTTRDIMRNVYEPLIVMDDNDEIQPVLASAYSVSADRRTVSFTLREGVRFHDGSTLDSQDVVASLERWIAQSLPGRQFMQGTVVTATGPYTVDVTTPRAMFTTLQLLAEPSLFTPIQPAEVVRDAPAEGVTQFVGTGPYQFVEWVTDQHVHLRRFEGYVSPPGPASGLAGAKAPVYENLYYDFVSDPSTRLAGLQTGQYDAANALPFDNFAQLEADPNVDTVVGLAGSNGLIFNKRTGVMSSPLMRQAANAALDIEAIQRAAFSSPDFYKLNGAIAADRSSSWYTDAGLGNYNVHDPARAQQLLAEAGYAGEPVRILTTREYADHYNSAVVVEAQLNAAGINAQLVVTDWATLLKNRTDDTAYEAFITGFTPTKLPTRNLFFSNSWPGWTNDPGITTAMNAITYAADGAAATAAMADLQQAFYSYLPIVKFGENSIMMGLDAQVDGYRHVVGAGDIFYSVHPR